MILAKKLEQYRRALEARIAELDLRASAEREARTMGTKTADPLDQAALEYEKQAALHKASADRQLRKNLIQALGRIRQGTYGECQSCGGEIEPKTAGGTSLRPLLHQMPGGNGTEIAESITPMNASFARFNVTKCLPCRIFIYP